MTSDLIIKIIADWLLVPIIILGIYALLFKIPNNRKFKSYSILMMAGLTSYLIAKIIGMIYQPSEMRPFELLGTVAGASFLNNPGFPSDHTLLITALTLAVWFETKQKFITIIMSVLIVFVCIGRVLALVHTPADVIGGVVIAMIGAVWYFIRTKSH